MEPGAGRPTMPAMTTTSSTHPAMRAFAWTAVFILWHGYWALGGDFGFGDQESGFPDAGWLFTVVVAGMFAAGLAVPLAVARDRGPRRLLAGLLWAGAAVLAMRGVAGLLDDALRFSGLAERGLTGLPDEEVLGSADPSAYTIWSTVGIDAFFAVGGALFGAAAWRVRPLRLTRLRAAWSRRPDGWEAYAASALAIAYAVLVRGYQGLGGTVGLPGTLEDPAGGQRASLLAGAFILLVGIGALALVRPWGTRLPRRLVIVPALLGSAFAIAHALMAYVTKPLHVLGVLDIEFRGWVRVDETALIAWDLLFYEPWFLALGVLVVRGTLHHHRRMGGSPAGRRRMLALTGLGTVALVVWAATAAT
jgi:hypothetical protein